MSSLTDDLAWDKEKKKDKKTIFARKSRTANNTVYSNVPRWKLLCCPFTNHYISNKIYPVWFVHNLKVPAFATGL